MSKKQYKKLACALALAAGFTAFAAPAYAAPEEEEQAAEESAENVTVTPEKGIMPSPEEIDAMAAGQSPEMLEALRNQMESQGSQAENGGEDEDNPYVADSPIPSAVDAGPKVQPVQESDIPVQLRTVKPAGYDPANPGAKIEQVAAEAGEAEADESEKQTAAPAEKPAETVKPAETAKPAEVVKPAAPEVKKEAAPEEKKEETAAEKKAREKAEKKALKEQKKAEKKALKAQKKAEKEAVRAKKKGQVLPEEPKKEIPVMTEEQKKAAEAQKAEADKKMAQWNLYRPAEELINTTAEKLAGQTIVDITIDGAGPETLQAAKLAVISRPGDRFAGMVIEKDREAIYDTGYFYDIYPTYQALPEGVAVTYHVMENPVLNGVEISGNTVEKSEELYNMITVKPGKVLNAKELHENIRKIEEKYQTDGYILVKLSGIDVGRDGILRLVINEGMLEGYSVKGNTKTKDKVVIREMRQKPGTPFNAKEARRGMQRIYNLGFFEDVNMKVTPGREPNAIVLELDVVEKRTGSFTLGGGYSTRDGFLGMIGIGDRNFRGTGQSFQLSYEFGGDDWDAHGLQFSYRRPWLDKHETAFGLKLYSRTYEFDDYDTHGNEIEEYMRKQQGYELTLSRPQSEYTTNYIMFRDRDDRYRRHKDGDDRSGNRWFEHTGYANEWRENNFGRTRSIIVNHITDTRDNIYNPTEGGKVDIMMEYAGFGAKFKYEKVSVEQTHFNKVGHAQVFAWRWAYGRGFGRIPELGQYRLGGQDTIRGYRDDIFRGNNMYLASLEYRFPIVRKVTGAIFTDAGAAWFGGWTPKGTHCSIGIGAAIETPIGPIRIDVGHGSNGNRVHFTVGGAF